MSIRLNLFGLSSVVLGTTVRTISLDLIFLPACLAHQRYRQPALLVCPLASPRPLIGMDLSIMKLPRFFRIPSGLDSLFLP